MLQYGSSLLPPETQPLTTRLGILLFLSTPWSHKYTYQIIYAKRVCDSCLHAFDSFPVYIPNPKIYKERLSTIA